MVVLLAAIAERSKIVILVSSLTTTVPSSSFRILSSSSSYSSYITALRSSSSSSSAPISSIPAPIHIVRVSDCKSPLGTDRAQKKIHWKQAVYDSDGDKKDRNNDNKPFTSNASAFAVVEHTWNWCQYFVRKLELCPWAPTSIDTPGAIQFFVVMMDGNSQSISSDNDNENDGENQICSAIINSVAQIFTDNVMKSTNVEQNHTYDDDDDDDNSKQQQQQLSSLERAAIYFVLFVHDSTTMTTVNEDVSGPTTGSKIHSVRTKHNPTPSDNDDDGENTYENFMTFYEWFMDLEDGHTKTSKVTGKSEMIPSIYDEHPDVIVAPFHPRWTFSDTSSSDVGGNKSNDDTDTKIDEDDDETIDPIAYEKRSPYPTISIVSARTVEQAGEGVTRKIGIHNEQLLSNYRDIPKFWRSSVFGRSSEGRTFEDIN